MFSLDANTMKDMLSVRAKNAWRSAFLAILWWGVTKGYLMTPPKDRVVHRFLHACKNVHCPLWKKWKKPMLKKHNYNYLPSSNQEHASAKWLWQSWLIRWALARCLQGGENTPLSCMAAWLAKSNSVNLPRSTARSGPIKMRHMGISWWQ